MLQRQKNRMLSDFHIHIFRTERKMSSLFPLLLLLMLVQNYFDMTAFIRHKSFPIMCTYKLRNEKDTYPTHIRPESYDG